MSYTRFKSLFIDTLFYGSSTMFSQVLGLVLLPVYTTYLSLEEFGLISILSVIPVLITPLANLGLNSSVFRFFYSFSDNENEESLIVTAHLIVIVFASLLLLGIGLSSNVIAAALGNSYSLSLFIVLAALQGYLTALASIPLVVMRLKKKVKHIAARSMISLLLNTLVSLLLIIQFKLGVLGFLIGNLVGSLSNLMFVIYHVPLSRLKLFKPSIAKDLLNYGYPFIPHHFLGLLIGNLGQILITSKFGLESNGIYSIALRIVTPLVLVINSFNNTWAPVKHEMFKEGKDVEKSFGSISFYYITILTFFWFSLTVIGTEAVKLFLAPSYAQAAMLIPFVGLVPLSQGFRTMMVTGLEFSNSPRLLPIITLLGFLFALALTSSKLVLAIGLPAVPISVALSWVLMSFLSLWYSRNRIQIVHQWKNIFMVLSLNVIAILLWFNFVSLEVELISTIGVGFIFFGYCTCLLAFLWTQESFKDFVSVLLQKFRIISFGKSK